MDKLHVTPENAHKIVEWLNTRGGLYVWKSVDLSRPSESATTPALTQDGQPYTKPHWRYANDPAQHITAIEDLVVDTWKEVRRGRIALRMGSQGMSIKLTDSASEKVNRWMDEAAEKYGKAVTYWFDGWDGKDVVIAIADVEMPMQDWLNANPMPEK